MLGFHILLGYGLDDRGTEIAFAERVRDVSFLDTFRSSYGTQPASYTTGSGVSFPEVKAARA
jgi:hypothetical protein